MYIIAWVWTHDTKAAKIVAMILGIITSALLIHAFISFGITKYKIKTYSHVTATVTSYDTRDANNVWTEFQYEYKNETYTIKIKGHSYWMHIGSEESLIVNPNKPREGQVLRYLGLVMPYTFYFSIPIGAVFILYFINFLVNRRRDRRILSQ